MPLHAEPPAETTQYLSLTVNRSLHDGLWPVRVDNGELWINVEDAARLGIAMPEASAPWVNLATVQGIQASYDGLQQQLALTLPEGKLASVQHLETAPHPASDALPQADEMGNLTLDYSLYSSETPTLKQTSLQSQLQTSGWLPGQLSNSMNSRFQRGDNATPEANTRLMTTWQLDFPASLTSISLGDSVTTGVNWSRQVRFGGLHLARNFQLDPQLNTAPRTAYSDSVVLPSTVDLYIDGLQQSHQQVTPGNYVLNTLPTFSGSGQAQVVITDINGQRREVTLDLYGAPNMLAQGVSSGSLDIGWLRQRYAERSNDYAASPMLDAGWRYGLNNSLTLSTHTEQHRDAHNLGVSGDWLVSPLLGIASSHIAGSQSPAGGGVKWGFGYQWNGQGLGVAASTSRSSDAWTDIARLSGSLPVRRTDNLWVSQALSGWGTLGAGWVRQDSARYLNASWSKSFSNRISTTFAFTHALNTGDKTVQLMLSVPLGHNDTVSLQTGNQSTRADYRHQPDYQLGGWSWQLSQNSGNTRQQHADLGYLSQYGEWHTGIDRDNQSNSHYLSGEGSFILLDSHPYALRYNRQGIALVTTDGISGVPIAVENRPAGTTDANGFLLLTDLPRYQNSKVSLDPLNLPPEVVTPLTEMHATPGRSEAVKVDFQVHRSHLVSAQLIDRQNRPLPIGSLITFGDKQSIVGREGFIWLENPPMPGTLAIQSRSGRCEVSLPASRGETTINLGVLPCH